MSWLKEIEDSLEKKILLEREKEESERLAKQRAIDRRKRDWENDGKALKVLNRWQELGCDKILEEIREVVWPRYSLSRIWVKYESGASSGLIFPVYERKKKGFFSKKTSKQQIGWEIEYYNGYESIESRDINELLARAGVIPSNTEFTVKKDIGYSYTNNTKDFRRHWEDVFSLTLSDSYVLVDSQKFPLEEIENASELKRMIIQVLRERSDLKERLLEM
jgi:hypothetical protein